jgi:hypothetical protein
MLKTFMESFGIFAVSVLVLFAAYTIAGANSHKATGIGWVHWKGFVMMGVGVLYFALGVVLTRVGR